MAHRSPLRLLLLTLFVPLLGIAGPRNCPWRAALYALQPESAVTRGCFDPCMCPLMSPEPVEGSFVMIEVPGQEAAPFREFGISALRWRTKINGEEVSIAGSGRYRVGGEFAQQQQLELDLRIGSAPLQHFDSGLVVGGGEFPKLDVSISVNGGYCYDTVIDVVAQPIVSRF
jgi:hypothetical protein